MVKTLVDKYIDFCQKKQYFCWDCMGMVYKEGIRRGKIGVDVAPVPVIGSSKCPAYFLCYSRNQNLCGVHATEVLPPYILSGGCCLFYRALRTTRFPPQSQHPPLSSPCCLSLFHPIYSQHCEGITYKLPRFNPLAAIRMLLIEKCFLY